MDKLNLWIYLSGFFLMLLSIGLKIVLPTKMPMWIGHLLTLFGFLGLIFVFAIDFFSVIVGVIAVISLLISFSILYCLYFNLLFRRITIKISISGLLLTFFMFISIILLCIFVFSNSTIPTSEALKRIEKLIEFGNNIKRFNIDKIRSGSPYIFQEMQDLRNRSLILLEELNYQDSVVYNSLFPAPKIDPEARPSIIFSQKLEYIDLHLAALNSIRDNLK